jgi:hypothetical protein
VADDIFSHLYTHNNGTKAIRFWRCSKVKWSRLKIRNSRLQVVMFLKF